MKVLCFLFFLSSSVFAQFDSARWAHQRDSSWDVIRDYPDALQWDSLYMVRWTFWPCKTIHRREDSSRLRDHWYYLERLHDDKPFVPMLEARRDSIRNEILKMTPEEMQLNSEKLQDLMIREKYLSDMIENLH